MYEKQVGMEKLHVEKEELYYEHKRTLGFGMINFEEDFVKESVNEIQVYDVGLQRNCLVKEIT